MSEHERTSFEEANGVATGFTGTIENWNADAEAKMAETLMAVGKYVQGESGCLLGHIKAAIFLDDGSGITLNLIDMDNGVEHHGVLARNDVVKFNFMCAVLDVDECELQHRMIHAIDDSGLDYHIDKESLKHHHHHDHEHGEECHCHEHGEECHCHDHEHHHQGHDGECSCGHHHEHGEECHCHDHEEHEHHYDENGVCSCGHHHHDLSDLIDENGKLRADHHHHHHDDEHEHHHEGECCCGHHHHDHDDDEHEHHHHHHDGQCCCGHHHD